MNSGTLPVQWLALTTNSHKTTLSTNIRAACVFDVFVANIQEHSFDIGNNATVGHQRFQ